MSDPTALPSLNDGLPSDIPFRAIIEQSLAGIYIMQDERFAYCNATWAALVGYTPGEMTGMHLRDLVDPDFLDTVLERYHKRLSGEVHSMRFLTRGLHRDGHLVHIEIHGSRMMFRGRPAVGGVGIDVTERLALEAERLAREEELRRSREQLQELGAYTRRKLEEQRLSFARDVHDELGGMLTALKMDATRILRRVEGEELRAMTGGVIDLTQQTIESVKAISESLRPSALDHAGLVPAIARDLAEFTARSGVAHAIGGKDGSPGLPPKRVNAVYRIFREGLTNIARHAQANAVRVDLGREDRSFALQLSDDGRGFTPSMMDRGSLGLLSMSERAREVGGELKIESAPGRGTRLVLKVPLL